LSQRRIKPKLTTLSIKNVVVNISLSWLCIS